MPTKLKIFKCDKCDKDSTRMSGSYYKTLKKYKAALCKDCVAEVFRKHISEVMTLKHSREKRNIDIVKVQCSVCGTELSVQYRAEKRGNNKCGSCSVRVNRLKFKKSYDDAAIKRRGDIKFADSVRDGLLKLSKDKRVASAKAAGTASWTGENGERERQRRKSFEHRKLMRDIWLRPGHKIKMSKITREMSLKLWQTSEYREKMARARSRMNRVSTQQTWLYSILDDLGIEHIREYQIGPWTFDCYLPAHNILIEVQGEYWHSLPKAIRLDASKSTYVSKYTNSRLVYFYEHEFYVKDKVVERLKYELGIFRHELVDFNLKDVDLRIIGTPECKSFLSKYHYLLPKNHAIRLGFYLGDDLIACCTYSPVSRKESATRLGVNHKCIRELDRFCIHPKYQKKNFGSWCIGKSIKWLKANRTDIELLVSFADTTVGHAGTIYKASNWAYDGDTGNSYYYKSGDGWVMHKKSLYNLACKMRMTEADYASEHGFFKVRSLPKKRYLYKLI